MGDCRILIFRSSEAVLQSSENSYVQLALVPVLCRAKAIEVIMEQEDILRKDGPRR